MIFDVETVVAIVLALVAGMQIFIIYNKYNTGLVDKVYNVVDTLYSEYKDKLIQDNPKLAEECEYALKTMKLAMEDGSISIMEAFDIAKTFVPLMNRLIKFIKETYSN